MASLPVSISYFVDLSINKSRHIRYLISYFTIDQLSVRISLTTVEYQLQNEGHPFTITPLGNSKKTGTCTYTRTQKSTLDKLKFELSMSHDVWAAGLAKQE